MTIDDYRPPPAPESHIFNKHRDRSIRITIHPGERVATATALRLSASGIEATSHVTLAAAEVDANGKWQPGQEERLPLSQNSTTIDLSAASAVLVSFTRI
jgi:hypothetical protein